MITCDFCGGPAVWTFIKEDVYYHCENQCDGFRQIDMFDEGLTDGDDFVRVDIPVSVSADRPTPEECV